MTSRLSRLTQLNRRLDGVLNEFKAMDLGTKPGEGLCPEPYDPKAPYYPSIYINEQKDSLDDIPAEGKAVIKYKVRSRTTSERNGVKKHSMSLDVLSIDPEVAQKDDAKKKAEGKAVEMSAHEFSFKKSASTFIQDLAGVRSRRMKAGLVKSGRTVRIDGNQVKVGGKVPFGEYWNGHGPETRKLNRSSARLAVIKDEEFAKRAATAAGMGAAGAVLWARSRAKKKAEGKAVEMRTGVSALPSYEFSGRERNGDGQFVANVTGGADPVTMRQAYGPDPKKSKLLAPAAAAGALATAGLLGTSKGRMMAVTGTKRAARVVRSAVTGIDRKIKGRDARNYPVMGSKAPKKSREAPGFGEVIIRGGKVEGRGRVPAAMMRR